MQLIQRLQFKKYQPTVNDLDNLDIHLIFCLFSSFPKYTENRTLLNDLGRLSIRLWFTYMHCSLAQRKKMWVRDVGQIAFPSISSCVVVDWETKSKSSSHIKRGLAFFSIRSRLSLFPIPINQIVLIFFFHFHLFTTRNPLLSKPTRPQGWL